jgi:16S rRNA (uracil1498-N3)-methyltransferase
MSLPRFFVDTELAVGQHFTLPEDVSHHALRVLRLEAGAPVVLFNGRGGEYPSRLADVGRRAGARIEAFDAIERESPLSVTLVQAWVATDKLDWIIEKAVELGVARVVLMPAARSVVRLDADRRAKRLAHLRQLAVSACAQCGRNRVPTVAAASDMAQALADLAGERYILRPDAASSLNDQHVLGRAATVMVGPEGGFDDVEVRAAEQLGCRSMRLGPRVLRTETAGLAALAVLQATAGDLAA